MRTTRSRETKEIGAGQVEFLVPDSRQFKKVNLFLVFALVSFEYLLVFAPSQANANQEQQQPDEKNQHQPQFKDQDEEEEMDSKWVEGLGLASLQETSRLWPVESIDSGPPSTSSELITATPLLNLSTSPTNNDTVAPSNGSSSDKLDEEFEATFMRFLEYLNILILIVGILGNSIVIWVIRRSKRLQTVNDIYMLNLAFADLMFVTGLLLLIVTMHNGDWLFGAIMCRLYMSSTCTNQFASSLLLVAMSNDRYIAVCQPVYAQRFRQPDRATSICYYIWCVCFFLQLPIFICAKMDLQQTCTIDWPDWTAVNPMRIFTIYSFTLGFASPLLLISVFYIQVVRRIQSVANESMLANSDRRQRSSRRISRLVSLIICTYTICWLPYWIFQFSVSFNLAPAHSKYFFVLYHLAASLSYANSALNPILYAFMSDNFTRRFKQIFAPLGIFFGQAPNSNGQTSLRKQQTTSSSIPIQHNQLANSPNQTIGSFLPAPSPGWPSPPTNLQEGDPLMIGAASTGAQSEGSPKLETSFVIEPGEIADIQVQQNP